METHKNTKPVTFRLEIDLIEKCKKFADMETKRTGYEITFTGVIKRAVQELIDGKKK